MGLANSTAAPVSFGIIRFFAFLIVYLLYPEFSQGEVNGELTCHSLHQAVCATGEKSCTYGEAKPDFFKLNLAEGRIQSHCDSNYEDCEFSGTMRRSEFTIIPYPGTDFEQAMDIYYVDLVSDLQLIDLLQFS